MNITNPAILLYEGEMPADKMGRNYYLQIIYILQTYKEAFTQQSIWGVLSKKLGALLRRVGFSLSFLDKFYKV